MKAKIIYLADLGACYPASLVNQHNWSLIALRWDPQDTKFLKTPISVHDGYAANRDGIGVPFSTLESFIEPNTIPSYRHPRNSPVRLGLIDCDNCVRADGSVKKRVRQLLKYIDSYAEYSVSGTGVHVLVWLTDVPCNSNLGIHKDRAWDIEFYWETFVVPITGDAFDSKIGIRLRIFKIARNAFWLFTVIVLPRHFHPRLNRTLAKPAF